MVNNSPSNPFQKHYVKRFPGSSDGKELPAIQETWVPSLGQENPLEEGMVTYSSILAWGIPIDRGTWWAVVRGVAKSWT